MTRISTYWGDRLFIVYEPWRFLSATRKPPSLSAADESLQRSSLRSRRLTRTEKEKLRGGEKNERGEKKGSSSFPKSGARVSLVALFQGGPGGEAGGPARIRESTKLSEYGGNGRERGHGGERDRAIRTEAGGKVVEAKTAVAQWEKNRRKERHATLSCSRVSRAYMRLSGVRQELCKLSYTIAGSTRSCYRVSTAMPLSLLLRLAHGLPRGEVRRTEGTKVARRAEQPRRGGRPDATRAGRRTQTY